MRLIRKNYNMELEKKIIVFMFIVGFIMMFLIPTWQTPDEHTHLNLIGQSIKNERFADVIVENVNIDINRMIGNYDEKVNIQEQNRSMWSIHKYDKNDLMPQGISLSIIKHLPATGGILLGVILGIPMYWVLQLGELFSLLFYVIVCYYALKVMPIKKELFAIIMLMPMALQQAGGIGYDSVLLPLCFLFIAYVFNLKFKETIELKHFLYLVLIWLPITYIKMPSGLLMLLILILPLDKISIRFGKKEINGSVIRKYTVLLIVLGMISLGLVIYFFRDNFYINIIIGLLQEWRRTLFLLKETGRLFHEKLIIESVGNFGWLDTPVLYEFAIFVYSIVLILALFNGDKKEMCKLRKWDMIVIWGTVILLCMFTTFGMVNHTIMVFLYGSEWVEETYNIQEALHQIPYIGGVQGRYYLPFVSLFFLPFPQVKQVGKSKMWTIVTVLEIAMFIYIMYVLMCRYWIA